ncbi:MAG: alpha-amylase [Gemmatimonadetes bacterium]|nr:alpha-amylase [Gemmatimonadota bacterium]
MTIAIRAIALVGLGALVLSACNQPAPNSDARSRDLGSAGAADPAGFWNSATVYFLLTDRFQNGDPGNDRALGRAQDGAVLRSFQGGDLAGVLRNLEEGYFDSLGVDAIWMTPFVEQIRGSVDEGTGKTYGYHGYWTRDWTAVEPALGTRENLSALVDAAHRHGIRVLMDAVINHTGPVTPQDPQWPNDWVRTGPRCAYRDYTTTVDCTLVDNLPDVRTERDDPVDLPPFLIEKWRREGRLDQERAALDAFFARTAYPRAPRYYLIKWLTDWVRGFGFDGYRMDTAKHFGEAVSAELKREAERAFADWKQAHPAQVLDRLPFYLMGEVYGWEPSLGRAYHFGDRTVDFFAHGYDGLINFGFKREAAGSLDDLFTRYSAALREGPLRGVAILNYVSSHDDGSPYDLDRRDPLGAGTRLLLAPGGAQVYYGDELARPLKVEGAAGDAHLRSFMNWTDLESGGSTAEILRHWRRLGQFRRAHPAVGAGEHRRLQAEPYIFSRALERNGLVDRVLVAMDQGEGSKAIRVFGVFPDGAELMDAYSGASGTVTNGAIALTTEFGLVLLSERRRVYEDRSVDLRFGGRRGGRRAGGAMPSARLGGPAPARSGPASARGRRGRGRSGPSPRRSGSDIPNARVGFKRVSKGHGRSSLPVDHVRPRVSATSLPGTSHVAPGSAASPY